MNIAVLSGKGGTGKTTVSVNLALALNASYIDCDVEEPNGFLFLKPTINKIESVFVDYPEINKQKCILCGECVRNCEFNALAKIKDNILLFEKLCHGCFACEIVCKADALHMKKREIGKIEEGIAGSITCKRGILNIGEAMAVPVIRELFKLNINNEGLENINILDCPPGTSCNVVNCLRYADIAVLVTEPSEFGLHDLKMAVELVKIFNLPFGIIINKDDGEENKVKKYCKAQNIKLIGEIPYSMETAKHYSKGDILYNKVYFKNIFDKLAERTKEVLNWN